MNVDRRRYHHGRLRPELLAAAQAEIADVGPAAMSLRRVAARAGVSHTAAAHHFTDKRGLLTALATEGHRALASALAEARHAGLAALGEAYIRFAGEHTVLFVVMFRPELLRTDDPDYVAASGASFGALRDETGTQDGGTDVAYGAWALVHGVAELWIAGNLPVTSIDDVLALFRRSARALAGSITASVDESPPSPGAVGSRGREDEIGE